MRAGFQRFWLSALAKFVTWDENASLKTPHGAYSFPLAPINMAEQNKIYREFFYDIKPDDHVGIIRFYENNLLYLDNKKNFDNKDDFEDYMTILGQYIISLEKIEKNFQK
jgi:hypothetical protein